MRPASTPTIGGSIGQGAFFLHGWRIFESLASWNVTASDSTEISAPNISLKTLLARVFCRRMSALCLCWPCCRGSTTASPVQPSLNSFQTFHWAASHFLACSSFLRLYCSNTSTIVDHALLGGTCTFRPRSSSRKFASAALRPPGACFFVNASGFAKLTPSSPSRKDTSKECEQTPHLAKIIPQKHDQSGLGRWQDKILRCAWICRGPPMYCVRWSNEAGRSKCGYHGWSPWRTCRTISVWFSVNGNRPSLEPACRSFGFFFVKQFQFGNNTGYGDTDPFLSGVTEVFLHVRCIPHQNSQWQFWASVRHTLFLRVGRSSWYLPNRFHSSRGAGCPCK